MVIPTEITVDGGSQVFCLISYFISCWWMKYAPLMVLRLWWLSHVSIEVHQLVLSLSYFVSSICSLVWSFFDWMLRYSRYSSANSLVVDSTDEGMPLILTRNNNPSDLWLGHGYLLSAGFHKTSYWLSYSMFLSRWLMTCLCTIYSRTSDVQRLIRQTNWSRGTSQLVPYKKYGIFLDSRNSVNSRKDRYLLLSVRQATLPTCFFFILSLWNLHTG